MSSISIMIAGNPVTIRRTDAASIIDLRHRILRPGLPREEAIFPGDELPTSSHFAAVTTAGEVVGCATFHLNTWQTEPAFQLRGMATDAAWKGKGIGTAVLSLGVQSTRAGSRVQLFWCNARLIAIPFYEKLGWRIASERFEIASAGPHHRMVLKL